MTNEQREFLRASTRKVHKTDDCSILDVRKLCIFHEDAVKTAYNVIRVSREESVLLRTELENGTIVQGVWNEVACVEPCDALDLTPFVAYSDECTYFMVGGHPDTGVENQSRPVLYDDSSIIRAEYKITAYNCKGVLQEQTLLRANTNSGQNAYSGTIDVNGYFIWMKARHYSVSLNTETVLTIPLSPTTAILTGCAGTVLATDLTYDGTNSVVMQNALMTVIKNYLCSLGFVDGVNFQLALGPNLSTLPFFSYRNVVNIDWIGLRRAYFETDTELVSYSSDGINTLYANSGNYGGGDFVQPFTLALAPPCTVQTYFISNRRVHPNKLIHSEEWRTFLFTGTYNYLVGSQTNRTCPINLYDFSPPECEGAEWFWQYSFDGVDPYVTVQTGGEFFEPEDQGYYKLLFICDGCEYEYLFTYFIP